MKHPIMVIAAVSLAVLAAPARAGITFGPVRGKAGESVRVVTHAAATGGTIEKTSDGKTRKGTMSMIRDRELVWTFRSPAADGSRRGMVKVANASSSTVVKLGGKEDESQDVSPLAGKMFAMTKAPQRDWKFDLDGSVPYSRVENEIEELKVYLNRNWFPTTEVNLGDSWEFDPAWVKRVIEKDLAKAQSIGTMRLRQIRHTEKRNLAIIDLTIRSTGADFATDGSEASATIDLTGQLTVNLDTMLDESLELKGKLVTTSNKPGEATKVSLPLTFTAEKSFVRDLTP